MNKTNLPIKEFIIQENSLNEDEKDVIRAMRGTEQGLFLSKVLGT